MKEELLVLRPACAQAREGERLSQVLCYALRDCKYREISQVEEFLALMKSVSEAETKAAAGEATGEQEHIASDRRGVAPRLRLLFAVSIGDLGMNLEYFRWLEALRENQGLLEGCVAGVIVDGNGELYTKSTGRQLILAANGCGCAFPGRPFAEGTGSLRNFHVQAKNSSTDVLKAYCEEVRRLVGRVLAFPHPPASGSFSEGDSVSASPAVCAGAQTKAPQLLVLHASRAKTSNTYQLWQLAREAAEKSRVGIQEISLRNGTIQDCGACPYTTCLHFGESGSCFYGGPMVEQVYPALRSCDGLLLLCPNYNDALSANLTAVINRMTALYRQLPFFDKQLFALIVSGYSGSDILAGQLVSALNMNKAFRLPSRFAVMETANDPGSAMELPDIRKRMAEFGRHIAAVLKGEEL